MSRSPIGQYIYKMVGTTGEVKLKPELCTSVFIDGLGVRTWESSNDPNVVERITECNTLLRGVVGTPTYNERSIIRSNLLLKPEDIIGEYTDMLTVHWRSRLLRSKTKYDDIPFVVIAYNTETRCITITNVIRMHECAVYENGRIYHHTIYTSYVVVDDVSAFMGWCGTVRRDNHPDIEYWMADANDIDAITETISGIMSEHDIYHE